LIYPERYEIDPTGKGLYERHCEEIGVQPLTSFIKHMHDRNLIMKFHGLGPQGMRAIAGNIEVRNWFQIKYMQASFSSYMTTGSQSLF
jgi:hypothetical protein